MELAEEDVAKLPMIGDANLFLKGSPEDEDFEVEAEIMIAGMVYLVRRKAKITKDCRRIELSTQRPRFTSFATFILLRHFPTVFGATSNISIKSRRAHKREQLTQH